MYDKAAVSLIDQESELKISKKGWAAEVAKLPIAFAQVREDSLIDLAVLQEYFPKGSVKMLMVASGGCTAAALASSPLLSSLHIVDPNLAQLQLTRFKLYLLKHSSPTRRLQILGHAAMPRDEREKAIIEICRVLSIPEDAFGDLTMVSLVGLDYAGRYEAIFSRLRERLAPQKQEIEALFLTTDIQEQRAHIAPETLLGKAIYNAFEELFSSAHLEEIFGKGATGNPRQPFALHFAEVTFNFLRSCEAWSSPYLAQMLLGHFSNQVIYPWLTMQAPKVFCEVSLSNSTMQEQLEKAEPNSFDLIHLSNILDWLSEEEARATLSLALKALREGGKIIIRQLNSSLEIPKLEPKLHWLEKESKAHHLSDRSFFYHNLYIAEKEEELFAEGVTKLADSYIKKNGIMNSPYFQNLASGKMSQQEFRKSQEQFYFAVAFFSRPMAALISRISDPFLRLDILHNIVEEHGDFDSEKFHKTTFEKFLKTLGSSVDTLIQSQPGSEVHAFNSALMGVCMADPVETAIACNGVIEYCFATISALIGKACIANGWIKEGELVHYCLHAELDIRHSQEFFQLLEPHLQNPDKRRDIEAGLELGVHLFDRLCKGILSN